MHLLQNIPIKRKLTIITMLTSGVALLLACIAFVTYEQVTFRRTMAAELSVLTDMFDDNVAAGLTFNDAKSIEAALNSLKANPHILAAAVYDKAGQPVASYQRKDVGAVFSAPPAGETGTEFRENRLDAFRRITLAGEHIGTIYIASDLREITARFWRYGTIVSIVLILSSLVALGLSAKLQHVISGPISHLAAIANTVATKKDYSVRAIQHGDDELGRLIDGFNGMLDQIQTRDSALQEARHDLEKRVEQRTVELSKANGELRDSAARFHTVWESAHDAMRLLDENGVIVAVNTAFCRMFGMKREELEGAPFTVTYTDDRDPAELQTRFRERFQKNHIVPQDERRMNLRDGRTVDLEISSTFVNLPGRPALLLGVFRDVTQRKRAEEALAQREDRFRSLIENSSDIITLIAADGTLLYESPSVQRILGYSPAELIGQNTMQFIHPEDASVVGRALMRISLSPGATDGAQFRFRHKDGTWRALESLGRNLLHHPSVSAIVINSRDITERKRDEKELEVIHKQLIDTSRQAGMAEVATGVLHNVGNVLNSVNVSATLLAEQSKKSKISNLAKVAALMEEHAADLGAFITKDPRGKQLPDYLAQLSRHLAAEQATFLEETDQLRSNIEHIKDIVAMQQSYARVSGVTETIQITDLVEDALRMNAGALIRHDVQVIREYGRIPPVTIDKHKVLQVLVNLIRNAKYACDESGRTDKQMTMRVANEGGRVRISIIDNGVGIPAENLVRIFNHGFTTRKEGHGFGLHSGALAAKELGGELCVHSDGIGRAATFTLELPAKTESPLTP